MSTTIDHPSPQVSIVRVDVGKSPAKWGMSVLLRTDAHWDNPDCRRDIEKRHLDEAKATNSLIIDNGDLFCAMQGKYDKRSDKSKVRPEHQGGDYLDRLVDTAVDYYAPYAHNFITLGEGNHETAISKSHETRLTHRLVEGLRRETGAKIRSGGYTGWVRFQFNRGTARRSVTLWHAHGWGGGGPVTLNTIQAANRMPMMVEADIVFTGHVHERWAADKCRMILNGNGVPERRDMLIVQGATYKDEYKDGRGGWAIEKGHPPKPVGAWWLDFKWTSDDRIVYDVRRAQ